MTSARSEVSPCPRTLRGQRGQVGQRKAVGVCAWNEAFPTATLHSLNCENDPDALRALNPPSWQLGVDEMVVRASPPGLLADR